MGDYAKSAEVYSKTEADAKYATQAALGDYAKSADVYSKTEADGKFATQAELNAKADVTALGEYAKTVDVNNALSAKADKTDLDTANGKITDLQKKTAKLSADGTELTGMTTVRGTTVSGDNVKAGELTVTGEIKDGAGVTTTLAKINDSMTQTATNTGNITDLKTKTDGQQTAINGLDKKTTKITYDAALGTNVDGVTFNAGKVTGVTSINGTEIGTKVDGNYIHQDSSIWGNMNSVDTQVKTNADNIKTNTTAITTLDTKVGEIDDRTGGITRNPEKTQTTIEGAVKVDNQGNVKDVKGLSAETITTGALTVTGKSDLKDNVILGTNAANTVTVNGTANFNAAVNMDKGLTVTNGETNLKKTTVDGDLKVTGTITTDKMVFGDKATNNYTEIDHGKVTSTNLEVRAGQAISSSSTFDVEKNEVGFGNGITGDQSYHKQTSNVITDTVKNNNTGDQSFHKQTSDVIMDNVKDGKNSNNRTQTKTETKDIITDENGNSSTTSQTASQNKTYLTDKDRKNTNSTIDTAKGYDKTIKGENGETSTKQDELNITNTAKDGTITNDANHIENKANTMDTTVTGKATESYGSLDTTVNGNETHIVKGTKTETVDGKVTENYKAGQATNVTGDQDITVSGTQTTKATDIKRNASSGMSDTIDNDYGTNTETKVAGKTTTDVSIKGTGEEGKYIRGANESRDYLIKGTLKNSETKTVDATSTEITDGKGKTSATIQDVNNLAGSVTNSTETGVSGIHANDNSVSIDSIVTDGNKYSVINQKKGSIQSTVVDGTNSTVILQDKDNVTIASSNGTVAIGGKDIVNNASENITNTAKTMDTTVTGKATESYGELDTTVTGQATENFNGGLNTKVTGAENHTVTGKQTNKIDGDQENTIGGNQTTTVTGDISNKAKNITNEASNSITDKVGDHTRVLDSDGITDTVGGSTFKQRIDKIMMESKNVSIKAEETLTNEAKVITNKASEVINNEAVNINNTATGIIKSKASEIQNQADKLISNKVGENTWENMEDGKITTSIKDGAKQNLTQSDAAGTTQSTVDGGKSTVTIQNADGLADAVTDGTNTSVQNQTASAIAAAVKDGAGNENASVANATTSVNTIKSGSKANTVISTADGTSFINSEAAAPVGDGTEVKTTIKGNTITTGKVTMDYAEVMKDIGVRGNANIAGKTTTGSLEVKGESKLTGDVTMESNATVKKDLTVEGNTNLKNTKVDGTLDVTQKATFGDSVSIAKDLSVDGNATIKGDVTAKSYKVGDKTYISAAGINANDQKITNVADGSISEGSKDAVNGGQLYTVKNDLEGKVNKVGANAAAMANLHPMEFDPSSKWNIAAAIGNYGSETAAALGAFYRPNDDVMVNLSTAFGTGENMVGGGVSVRLGKGGNKLSREENNALKDQVNDLTARMDALLSVLNPNMSKDFPDVPENHWAYEAVSRLAGNDIVQGYPDGEFHGERTMTRYEMAEIIYNALSRGAEAEKELVEEFKPELQAMAASEKATAEKAEG